MTFLPPILVFIVIVAIVFALANAGSRPWAPIWISVLLAELALLLLIYPK